MESLPLLVLEKIFSELASLNEMVRCSLVCRNWRAAYEACKPTTLCLFSKAFMPLNHRLTYSTERVRKCQLFKTFEDLQFLASEITIARFANLRKLVIFTPNCREYGLEYHPFSFRKQLNHFKKLEYLEIQKGVSFIMEDSELDLPMLKVLCFNANRKWKEFDEEEARVPPKVLLNTPSLEVLEVQPYDLGFSFSEFILKYPNQLRSLTVIPDTAEFNQKTKFEQLECLAVRLKYWEFTDDFLTQFPNLKLLLLFTYDRDGLINKKLTEQKKRFGLDDLEVLINSTVDRDYTLDLYYTLDHENWRKYVRHEQTFKYCPIELVVDLNQAIEYAVPLDRFQSFFRLNGLKVGRVADPSLLVDFLRIVETFFFLHLNRECNLDQSFFNEVANFLTVHRLHFHESILNRLSDYAFLEKFNYCVLSLRFQNLPREAFSAALKKPNCYIHFQFDREPIEVEQNENEEPAAVLECGHFIVRHPAFGFVCKMCYWVSARDPDSNSSPVEATIRHAEHRWTPPEDPRNLTPEEYFAYSQKSIKCLID